MTFFLAGGGGLRLARRRKINAPRRVRSHAEDLDLQGGPARGYCCQEAAGSLSGLQVSLACFNELLREFGADTIDRAKALALHEIVLLEKRLNFIKNPAD